MAITEELLQKNQGQMERVLDLYLENSFDEEILVERKQRFETTIKALERERVTLAQVLEARRLTTQ